LAAIQLIYQNMKNEHNAKCANDFANW